MKSVLALVAATGLSVTAAAAECAGHAKVSASADQQTRVASVNEQLPPQPAGQSAAAPPATETE